MNLARVSYLVQHVTCIVLCRIHIEVLARFVLQTNAAGKVCIGPEKAKKILTRAPRVKGVGPGLSG